jgi:hypothetical protein
MQSAYHVFVLRRAKIENDDLMKFLFNKEVRKWRRSLYADRVPQVVQDAQKWLSQPTAGAG